MLHTYNLEYVSKSIKVQTRLHRGPISPSYSHLNCPILSSQGIAKPLKGSVTVKCWIEGLIPHCNSIYQLGVVLQLHLNS